MDHTTGTKDGERTSAQGRKETGSLSYLHMLHSHSNPHLVPNDCNMNLDGSFYIMALGKEIYIRKGKKS